MDELSVGSTRSATLTSGLTITNAFVTVANKSILVVSLQVSLKNNGLHFCGGALVSLKHVLTAGHCVVE
uniref:Peptidase S1 domain-containing protein n=1 Tax=Timema cristinae TaxID=61476 RepID=A0A7R9D210_TIMCR|nr:unnamed protein product [Timema cristinae]